MTGETTHEHEPFPRPPDGRRVVWVGEWPAVEDSPRSLPGIITSDLPDGWAYVSWVDKKGWYSPDAVYETKLLQEVPDDRFFELVRTIRDSDWPGLRHDVPSPPVPSWVVGDTVRLLSLIVGDAYWDPDRSKWREDGIGGVRGLTRDHPGTIAEVADDATVRVRWVDKDGEFEASSFISPDLLAPIGDAEAKRLAAEVRGSDWEGLRGAD